MTHKFHGDIKNSPNSLIVSTTDLREPSSFHAILPPLRVRTLPPPLIYPENTLTYRGSSTKNAQHSSLHTSHGTVRSTFSLHCTVQELDLPFLNSWNSIHGKLHRGDLGSGVHLSQKFSHDSHLLLCWKKNDEGLRPCMKYQMLTEYYHSPYPVALDPSIPFVVEVDASICGIPTTRQTISLCIFHKKTDSCRGSIRGMETLVRGGVVSIPSYHRS